MIELPVVTKLPKGSRFYRGSSGPEYTVPKEFTDWQAALIVFGMTAPGELKLSHWHDFVSMVWPDPVFIWDEWSDLFFGACCGAKETVERVSGAKIETTEKWWRRVVCSGAGSTGKSAKAALWVLGQWLCAREVTTVVLTSTSMDQLKRRIWHSLLKWINSAAVALPLEPLPGDCEIRWAAGDKLSCIFGIPVKSGGEESESIDRIKGLHNRRTFLVIDEMTSMPDAIIEGGERNLRKGTLEHQVIGLGNAGDPMDLHGRNMEPEAGWNSISAESVFWLNKLGGCSLHFDGLKSPRLRDDARFHYYIGAEDIEIERRWGGGEGNPRYWSEVRGFWPPAGMSNTVMDAALLAQFNTAKPAVWDGLWQVGAGFDVAFEGGDRRVLYPFRWGKFTSGQTGVEFQPPIIVNVDMKQDKRFLHYQISDAVQNLCEGYRINDKPAPILPENFLMDVTGEGAGPFGIMSGRWSDKVQAVEFGGAAEKVQIAPNRPSTWYELYGNKVSMLWYCLRRFIEGDQVRGLNDPETITELTSRNRFMRNGKTLVVPKSEMKLSKSRSPDKADAAVIVAEFMRRKGIAFAGNTGGGVLLDFDAWNAMVEKRNQPDQNSYEDSGAAYA